MSSIAAGPWGGQCGYQWDDGAHSTVRQIVITSAAAIDSIQFEYDDNGRSIWSDKHGRSSGIKTDKIKLGHPIEFLISISGHCGPLREGDVVIVRSLSFESNKKKYGPFGIEQGMPFSLPTSGGKLVGFHGRSSWYLDAIGVYVMPLMQRNPALLHQPISHGLDGKFTGSEPAYPIGKSEPNNFMVENITGYGVSERKVGKTGSETAYPIAKSEGNNFMVGNITGYEVSEQKVSKRIVSFGPWGADSGATFDDGIYTGVREIHITRSGGLVSIRVCYDQNGKVVWGDKNGGTGGLKFDKIVFDYPFELLTHISGYYESTIFRGPTIVKSITFHTTKRSYGPFGDQQGFSFSSGTNGIVVGFHGRKGYFVNSIGVHVLEGTTPLRQPYPDRYGMSAMKNDPFDMSAVKNEVVWAMPRAAIHDIGPWGGEGGQPWDDGVHTGVRKIHLTRSGEAICSIQIEYDRNGQPVWAAQHGAGNEACTHLIKFNYPHEVLTCISGYYDALFGDRRKMVVRALSFQTNRARYGPYGKEIGTHFSSAKTEGKVIGFHGQSAQFLDAIGVHMQCFLADEVSCPGHIQERGVIRNMLHKIMH